MEGLLAASTHELDEVGPNAGPIELGHDEPGTLRQDARARLRRVGAVERRRRADVEAK